MPNRFPYGPSLAMTTFLLPFKRENVPAGKSLRRTQNLSKFLLHLVLHGALKMKSMRISISENMYVGCMDIRKKMSIMSVINYLNVHILEKIR